MAFPAIASGPLTSGDAEPAEAAPRPDSAVALDGKPLDYSTLARIGRGDIQVGVTAEGLERVRPTVEALAAVEGLPAHAAAVAR